MSFSDILVCMDSTEAGADRLKLALRLAQQQSAYLIAAYVLDDRPESAAMAEEAEQRFRQSLRLQGISGDWRLIDGPNTAEIVALAKAVDLAILGQYSRQLQNGMGFKPDDIATACGRPLLVVPYIGGFASVGENVLIAWDGTREATRALNDALPLLETAKSATLMTVVDREREFDRAHAELQRIVAHLEHHGVSARSEEVVRGSLTVSDLLLSRAADLGADMIVAGVYHHSPLREALIGGVSRDLLRHMTVPVLMSH
ncbi:MAG TPA: universal stress protein [Stellaceae bacterium]|nr:universal stress protein [Stellaceae bacterium]